MTPKRQLTRQTPTLPLLKWIIVVVPLLLPQEKIGSLKGGKSNGGVYRNVMCNWAHHRKAKQ